MLVIPCLSFGAIDAYNGGLTLAFRNAIWHGENHKAAVNVVFDVSCDDGTWSPLYGIALNYSNGHHRGMVDKAVVTDTSFEFEVDCVIEGDDWLPGQHQATWLVKLKRNDDGSLTGT